MNKPPAAPQTSSNVTSSFPLPPMQYIKNYDPKNQNFPPPPTPISDDEPIWLFGACCAPIKTGDNIIQSLESRSLQQVYKQKTDANFDPIREMKGINVSIVLKFLDLLDLLRRDPQSEERQKLHTELELLFVNIHQLVNEYRPHQAKETLIVLMQMQEKSRRETSEKLCKLVQAVKNLVKASLADLKDIEIKSVDAVSCLKTGQNGISIEESEKKSEIDDSEMIESIDQMHDELMDSILSEHL